MSDWLLSHDTHWTVRVF